MIGLGKRKSRPDKVLQPPGGGSENAESRVWYHLCSARIELNALVEAAGPKVRRHAIVNTMVERAMGYYYLFVIKGRV